MVNFVDKPQKNAVYFHRLIVLLCLVFLLLPVLSHVAGQKLWFLGHITFAILLLSFLLSIRANIATLILGIFLSLSGLAFSAQFAFERNESDLLLFIVCDVWFLVLMIKMTLWQVVQSEQVNLNNISGAVCVYLLFGLLWSLLYYGVAILVPNAFEGNLAVSIGGQFNDYVYFSFVTLTTLGYGDILPVHGISRALAFMEAVIGQFYIAVLVAGLVAMLTNQKGI